MRKQESEQAIRALCHQWREARDFSNTPADHLSFTDFLAWIRQNDPRYLQFSTSASVEYDAMVRRGARATGELMNRPAKASCRYATFSGTDNSSNSGLDQIAELLGAIVGHWVSMGSPSHIAFLRENFGLDDRG